MIGEAKPAAKPDARPGWKQELASVIPIGIVGAILGVTTAYIVLAHPVEPLEPPIPTIDGAPLAAIAAADREARKKLDSSPPPTEIRAIGTAYLAWNTAASEAPLDGSESKDALQHRKELGDDLRAALAQARSALRGAMRKGAGAGDGDPIAPFLRDLRSYHTELFLGEFDSRARTGVASAELKRLAGALFDVLVANGWIDATSGHAHVPHAVLRTRFKLHWTSVVFGLDDCDRGSAAVCYGLTSLPIDPEELRALLAFLVAHPVVRASDREEAGGVERAVDRRRLVYVDRMVALDRFADPSGATHPYSGDYPTDLARGAMLYKLGQYGEAELLLRTYLAAHRQDMRARNWLLAAMRKTHPEE